MNIEVHLSHPRAILFIFLGIVGFITWSVSTTNGTSGMRASVMFGGSELSVREEVLQAEEDIRRTRQERAVLERKEEILRYQLKVLEEAMSTLEGTDNTELFEELRKSSQQLIALLQDKHRAEEHLLTALHQLWDAELRGGRAGAKVRGKLAQLAWPIEPSYGVSAMFHDKEYEQIFGLQHNAIDIPTEQGTVITAAADGIVEHVADNGEGYSYVILKHEGGATLYAHTVAFLVKEGQQVRQGEAIALSGGQPGSMGAGALSTGPHLHFETIVGGERVDPLAMLPTHNAVSN